MVEENEIIVLLLGIGTFWFIQANRVRLGRLPAGWILITGFYLFLAGWFFSVINPHFSRYLSVFQTAQALLFIW
jgi:hypothetical protein